MPRKATASKKAEKKSTKEAKPSKSKPSKSKPSKSSTSTTQSKSSKSKKSVKVAEVAEVAEQVEPAVSDVEEVTETPVKKKRYVPTKESVIGEFNDLVVAIDEEIARLRESSSKTKGVKFLRSLNKRVKTVRGHTARVMKQKQKTKRTNNTNSGFLKPVQISKEMAKFTGWESETLRSRVDVTKYICNYIREHELQNPEDRRQIRADKKLAKLLEYKHDDEKPLTYYRLQTYMKKHFTNPPTESS